MDPDQIIDKLLEELNAALKALGKTKNLEEKEAYSRIVKNLADAIGVFFNAASDMMMGAGPDDEDEIC